MSELIPIKPEKEKPFVAPCTYECHIAEGFDLDETLLAIQSPIIEIAGPTYTGYKNIFPEMKYANILPTGQRIQVSNINAGEWGIDFVCDGTNMQFDDESIGAILLSHIPAVPWRDGYPKLRILQESARVIEKGGLLIIQSILDKEIDYCKELGLYPMVLYVPSIPARSWDVVFQMSPSS